MRCRSQRNAVSAVWSFRSVLRAVQAWNKNNRSRWPDTNRTAIFFACFLFSSCWSPSSISTCILHVISPGFRPKTIPESAIECPSPSVSLRPLHIRLLSACLSARLALPPLLCQSRFTITHEMCVLSLCCCVVHLQRHVGVNPSAPGSKPRVIRVILWGDACHSRNSKTAKTAPTQHQRVRGVQ